MWANGTVTQGPELPEDLYLSEHCMVQLHNNSIMIIPGLNNLKTFVYHPESKLLTQLVGDRLRDRRKAGCALFYSAKHDNRPVVYIGGGMRDEYRRGIDTEILDYTLTTVWEKCKYILAEGSQFFNSRFVSKLKLIYFGSKSPKW